MSEGKIPRSVYNHDAGFAASRFVEHYAPIRRQTCNIRMSEAVNQEEQAVNNDEHILSMTQVITTNCPYHFVFTPH